MVVKSGGQFDGINVFFLQNIAYYLFAIVATIYLFLGTKVKLSVPCTVIQDGCFRLQIGQIGKILSK